MIGEYSHKTNKKIIIAMLAVFFVALMLLQCSCTATKLNRSTSKSDIASENQTTENQQTKTNIFDRSRITQEDYSLRLIPIDPSKAIGQTTNPDTGEKQWRNAIPVYEKKTKTTDKNVTKQKNEAKTKDTNEKSEATTNETTKDKIKFSIPWYAFIIIGFFFFAAIIGLFFVYKLFKTISPLVSAISTIENRLKTLEQ